MKQIGILFGMENSFPGALADHINARNIDGIQAEFALVGVSGRAGEGEDEEETGEAEGSEDVGVVW